MNNQSDPVFFGVLVSIVTFTILLAFMSISSDFDKKERELPTEDPEVLICEVLAVHQGVDEHEIITLQCPPNTMLKEEEDND